MCGRGEGKAPKNGYGVGGGGEKGGTKFKTPGLHHGLFVKGKETLWRSQCSTDEQRRAEVANRSLEKQGRMPSTSKKKSRGKGRSVGRGRMRVSGSERERDF